MNTMRSHKIIRLAGLALASLLLAGLTSGLTAQEKFTGKGAARLLLPPASTQSASAAQPMSCPKCKDAWVARKDTSVHGAIKAPALVVQHLCGGCETTLTLTGNGKAAHQVAAHSCTAGGPAGMACCDTQRSVNAPGKDKKL
ncbi:MAG TPA: hypothetical protein VN578_19620 [Candidatus Binatia bacterium]|nr:hypothetical protein [Candidatus Binatia bacterium]